MNFKNLFRLGSLAVLLVLFLIGAVDAQTFYVNNQTGSDGYDGSSQTWVSGVTGPKRSVAATIAVAPGNNTISVAYTGVDYSEPSFTVSKNLTFTTTGGQPIVFSNAILTVNGTDIAVAFNGRMDFANGFVLQSGSVTGGNNLKVGTKVTKYWGTSITGHLQYTAALDFEYVLPGATDREMVTGDEFPTQAENTMALDLTTTETGAGNLTLKLNETKTVNDKLDTDGPVNLNGYTLNLVSNDAHTLGGDVTNGTLAFTMDGPTSIDGTAAVALPNITATSSAAQTLTIDPAGAGSITTLGNVTANGSASIVTNNTGNVADVTANGIGSIDVKNNGTVGTVLSSSTAAASSVITLFASSNTSTSAGITVSGLGKIAFGADVTTEVKVNGNVLLNTAFTLTGTAQTNSGLITFPDVKTTITGSVTNNTSFGGTTSVTNADKNNTGLGNITFGAADKVVALGNIISNVMGTPTLTSSATNAAKLTASGNISFAYLGTTAGRTFTANNVTNQSTLSAVVAGLSVVADCAKIEFTGATDGTNGSVTIGTLTNSSSTGVSNGTVGLISFGAAGAAPISVASVSSTGAFGGDIQFGIGTVTVTGDITSSRTQAGADILFGAATAGVKFTAANILNSGSSNIVISSVQTSVAPATVAASKIENTGTGTISFPGVTSATFSFATLNLSDGTLSFANAALGVGAITVSNTFSATKGNLAFGSGVRTLTFKGTSVTIGGATTNPTITGANTTLSMTEPIPNVLQTLTIGGANPSYPGPLSINNAANIPSPVVSITGGNLYVTNDVTFTGSTVVNAYQLNGARIYVGKKDPAGFAGNFQNTSGYSTINDGRVVMSGNAAQTVNAIAATAGATFGAFEVDNSAAGTVVSFTNPATFTDFFYLSKGDVSNLNLVFNAPAPYPTIVRSQGSFVAAPTFTSMVNVIYIGLENTSSFEVPAATDKLFNLTVATTNHTAQAGRGVVSLGAAATVNGTLTVNDNQTLFVNGHQLTLAGPSAVINGDLANTAGTPVALARPNGTAVTGKGFIPSVTVMNGSQNNTIGGQIKGLVDGLLGVDAVRGNGNDVETISGSINYQNAALGTTSSLTVAFASAGPHFSNIVTYYANDRLTLGSNVVMNGNIDHAAGIIDLQNYTLTHQGTAPFIDGGARIIGAGKLLFNTGAPTMTVNTANAVIETNVDIALPGAGVFTLANGAGTFDLEIDGNLHLISSTGNSTNFAISAGRVLDLGGANVTVDGASQFSGTGALLLDVVAPATTLTFNVPANTTISNLTVADNVTLAGPVVGTALTVTGNFVHAGGLLTFSNSNLVIGAAGTFTRSGNGTYSGTGYLVYGGPSTSFQHSSAAAAGAMTIDNLRFTSAVTLQNAVNLNVIKILDLQASLTNQVGGTGAGYVIVGDGSNVPTVNVDGTSDVLANALQFGNPLTNYRFTGVEGTVSTNVWPAGDRANNVTIEKGAPATREIIPASKSIAANLNLVSGVMTWDSPTVITLANGVKVYRSHQGSLNNNQDATAPAGTLTASLVNLEYWNNVGNTGIEYSSPAVVQDLTLDAVVAPGSTTVNLVAARTVSGNVTLNSTLNINENTTFVMPFTAPSTATVTVAASKTATFQGALAVNSASFTNNGSVVAGDGLTITGTVGSGTEFANNGTLNVTGAFSNAADYTGAGSSVLTATTAANTGTMSFGSNSVLTVTGVLSLGGAVTFPAAGADAIINVPVDFGFSGTATNSRVTINTTGAATQSLALTNALTVNNFNVNKTANVVVRISGNNLTVNTNLGLTKGLLRVDDPYYITLNLTTTGNIISGMGYTRTPALATDWAHVYGKLGVAIPAGSIGRTQWPVGSSDGDYRPAAITFTAGNATIAPTTIIVSHVDAQPAGDVNLTTGINGGTKFYDPSKTNMIRGKAPYYWLVSATNSLGASQLFDVELQGTNLNRKFETVNDLRIIRRFDGDISVNGWALQGNAGNYSNILQANNPNPGDTIITVRNIASQGGIVNQAALFTIGVPSQAPVFTVAGTLANTAIDEGTTFTFQYAAQDPDVAGSALTYSLVNPIANASVTSAGLLTFTPDFTQGTNNYTFVVKAAKTSDATASTTTTAVITVNNVNQAPAFTVAGKLADQSVKNGQTLTFDYAATDADAGDVLTYSLVNPPAGVSLAGAKLTWTPTFAQISATPYVITVKVTDNGSPAKSATTVANVTVKSARLKGDVTNDAVVASNDASKVLQMVVEAIPTPAAGTEDFYAADTKVDNMIGAMDAYYILSYVNSTDSKYPDGSLAKETATGNLAFGTISSKENIVTVPVSLSGAQNVHSIKLSLDVDNSKVDLSSVSSSLPEGWMMMHNYADGRLNIVMVGLSTLSNGTVASINFALKNKEARAELSGTMSLNDATAGSLAKIGVKQVPSQFELSQNYPNPFNPTTTVKYSLAVDSKVTLSVYNMVGQKIRTLVDGQQESGYYSITWDGANELGQKVASGIYIYRLETGSFVATKKMNLLK